VLVASHDWQIVEWYSQTVEALATLGKMDRGGVTRVPDDQMDDKEGEGAPTDFWNNDIVVNEE